MLMIVKTKCQFTKNRNYKSEMKKKRNMKNDKPAYYYYKHNCSSFLGSSSCKFFTYVAKTLPNLSTIIFEIDIMKMSSQSIENSHFCHCKNHHVTSFQTKTNQTPKTFVKKSKFDNYFD